MGTSKYKVYNGFLQGSLDTDTCDKLIFLRRAFENNESIAPLENLLYNLTDEQVDYSIAHEVDIPVEERPQGTLRPYQTVGVAFMYYAKSCLLGDSVGLGKTAQVAGLVNLFLAEHGRAPKVLFFSDKNAVNQIRREMIRFTGQFYRLHEGTRDSLEHLMALHVDTMPNLVIPSHVIRNNDFQSWMMYFRPNTYDIIVVDESSCLGNSTTQIYKAAKELFKGTERIILLNATPFETDLGTFYNQLNLLDPNFLPTKKEFDSRYRVMDYSGIFPKFSGRYRNTSEVKQLVGLRYLTRTRKDLGATFTNCTADVILSKLTPSQRALLRNTQLHRQVYDCPWTIQPMVGTPKIRATKELLDELFHLRGVTSTLIYANFRESQERLRDILDESGYSVEVINGSTSTNDSSAILDRFREGTTQVLITNVQKALNLPHCNHCIFYGYNPNPNKMIQFEGRITRSFDIHDKHVYMVLTEGKEFNTFRDTILQRAKASDGFAGSDFNLVISLLTDKLREMGLSTNPQEGTPSKQDPHNPQVSGLSPTTLYDPNDPNVFSL